MENKKIYSVTGLFNTPDEIIHAVEKTVEAGYRKYDVNTPYPVHGMDSAMKLKPSTLGYFTLVLGLSGAAIAILMMWFTMSVDYPLLIGGKPTFALPAFIPVTFEVSVLLGSLGTVAIMIFFFFKLPNNSHPIHDTEYMKAVSVDKFGIYIEATDKNFDEEKVTAFLKNAGAFRVATVYWDNDEVSYKPRVFDPRFITFLVVIGLITSGATYLALNKLAYASPFNFMMNQDRQNVQSKSVFFSDGFGMRPPVEGTVARGHMPDMIGKAEDSLWVNFENPLPVTKESLELGKKKYDIYCSPCHGMYAKGDSRLRGQFPNPPSLHSEKVRNWKDSQIYLVITSGQNSMPSYAAQMEVNERWAVVNYIRAIQRALNAKEGDLK